jgi:two-component system chemotaxis response regulator CheB
MEAAIAAQEHPPMTENDMRGPPSSFICPECGGPLWEIEDGGLLRYRCRVGHALTAEAVLTGHEEEVERALWNLLQTQEQRAELVRRMADASGTTGGIADLLRRRARDYEEDSEIIRGLLRRAGEAQSEGEDKEFVG